MPTKKFQQGGVFPVNVPNIPVGDIAQLGSPQLPDLLPLTGREIASLSMRMQQQELSAQARKEASDLAEQRYQDSLENAYLDYNTKFFGDVHSAQQKETIEKLSRKYGLPDKGSLNLLENQVLLKDTNRNFRRAMSDPDFINVIGEVDRGNKFRDYAQKTLSAEDFTEWEQTAWQPYTLGQTKDIESANPVKFKSAKNVDFGTTTRSALPIFDGVDFGNPVEVEDMEYAYATQLASKDPDAAVRQGLITMNGDVPELTPTTRNGLYAAVKSRQNKIAEAAAKTDERKMDVYAQQRAIADAYADGNRQGRSGSGSSGSDAPEDIEEAYSTIEALEDIVVPRDSEKAQALVRLYAKGTEAERKDALAKLKKISAAAPKTQSIQVPTNVPWVDDAPLLQPKNLPPPPAPPAVRWNSTTKRAQ